VARGRAAAVAGLALIFACLSGLAACQPGMPPPAAEQPPSAPADQPAEDPGATAPARLHVTAAGDYSSGREAAGVLARIGALKPDAHFALGDLSYGSRGEEQRWCDLVASRTGPGFPFELVAGNHESNGKDGHIDDFAACLPNRLPGMVGAYGRQYYVDVPRHDPVARFIMVSPGIPFRDGTLDYSAGSARYNWTAAAIDGARSASIPWVVVGMHTVCLSVGVYGCEAGSALTDLMVSKDVDLVLNGHEHLYQRTKQLSTGTGCTAVNPDAYNAKCVRNAGSTLSKGEGTVFVTVGTGGVPLRRVHTDDPEAPYFAAYSGQNAKPSHGLLDLRFTGASLTGRFVATTGSFQDGFTITGGR
jgi:hypothetical protein